MAGLALIPFGPDSTCTLELCPIQWSVYQYRPSLAANITFVILYTALGLLHLILGIRWKTWSFTGCVIFGCIFNIIGYAARILLWQNPFSFVGFLIQIILIGSGPVFFSAAIYITIAKVVQNLDLSLSRIPPKFYYIIFLTIDVSVLVFQAIGGALSTTTRGGSESAIQLSLAGLSIQVISMVAFAALMGEYLARYFKRHPNAAGTRLKVFLTFLSLSTVLIIARCAYRVYELSEGYSGTAITNEPLFIALEGVLIVVAVTFLLIGNPGFVFSRSEKGTNQKITGHEREEEGATPLEMR